MTDTHDLVLAQLEALRREVQQLRGEVAACRRGRRTAWLGALCLALLTIAATGLWLPSSEVLAQRPDDPRLPPPKKDGAPQPPGQHLVVQSLKIVGADGKDRLSLGYDDISGYVKVHGPDGKVRAQRWQAGLDEARWMTGRGGNARAGQIRRAAAMPISPSCVNGGLPTTTTLKLLCRIPASA